MTTPYRVPTLDTLDKIKDKFLPDWVVSATKLANALTGISPTQQILDAIDAALLTTPLEHKAVAGTYGGRPVSERPVYWASPSVPLPTTPGTTTSGTGPVIGLDKVLLEGVNVQL